MLNIAFSEQRNNHVGRWVSEGSRGNHTPDEAFMLRWPPLSKRGTIEKVEELKGWISDFLVKSPLGRALLFKCYGRVKLHIQRRRGTKVVRPSSVILG